MNKRVYSSLLLTLIVPFSGVWAVEEAAGDSTTAQACRVLHRYSEKLQQRFRQPGETVSPRVRSLEVAEQAVEACSLASKQADNSEEAAELVALSYLNRARLVSGHKSDPDRRRAILTEGIATVSSLDHDRSPALFELLKQSAATEWDLSPRRGIELMGRAVEIAERSFGSHDPRLAEALSELGFMHAPTVHPGSEPKKGTDPRLAEELHRRALDIWAHVEDPPAYPAFSASVVYLKDLLQSQGRTAEVKALEVDLLEIYDQEKRALETKRNLDPS